MVEQLEVCAQVAVMTRPGPRSLAKVAYRSAPEVRIRERTQIVVASFMRAGSWRQRSATIANALADEWPAETRSEDMPKAWRRRNGAQPA